MLSGEEWISSFAAALGGLDTLVFSAGIGENSPSIRARICHGLGFLGIELNKTRNAKNSHLISPDAGRVKVRVIRTDEGPHDRQVSHPTPQPRQDLQSNHENKVIIRRSHR